MHHSLHCLSFMRFVPVDSTPLGLLLSIQMCQTVTTGKTGSHWIACLMMSLILLDGTAFYAASVTEISPTYSVTGTGAYALEAPSQKACEVENNILLISSIENIGGHRVLYVVDLPLASTTRTLS